MDTSDHHPPAAMDEEETLDRLSAEGLQLFQPRRGYRFALDALLLADFVGLPAQGRAADLGTGSGVVMLILAHRHPRINFVGFELQPRLAAVARRNVELNRLAAQVEVEEMDWRDIPELLPAGGFRAVFSNPPYRKLQSGRVNPQAEKALARHEVPGSLRTLAAAAAHLLSAHGRFALVFLPDRLAELFAVLEAFRLTPKRVCFVHPHPDQPAAQVLVEAIKEARPGVIVAPPIFTRR